MKYSNGHMAFDDNWWRLIWITQPVFEYKGTDDINPYFDNNDFAVLHQENLNQYMVVPQSALNLLPLYDATIDYHSYGGKTELDGKYCSPIMQDDRLNHVYSQTFKSLEELTKHYTFPYYVGGNLMASRVQKHFDIMKGSYILQPGTSFHYKQGKEYAIMVLTSTSTYHVLKCDPYSETTSYLPTVFAFLSKVLTDCCWVAVTLIMDLVDYVKHTLIYSFTLINQKYYFSEIFVAFAIVFAKTRNLWLSLVIIIFPLSYTGIRRI